MLLGVEKNRVVSGLTRVDPRAEADGVRTYDRLEEWVMQACRDKIRPGIIPYFEVVRDVEPGRDVAVVEVEPGWSVHHVWHDQRDPIENRQQGAEMWWARGGVSAWARGLHVCVQTYELR